MVRRRISLVALVGVLLFAAVACEQPVLTLTVNTNGDSRDAAPGNGVCANTSGLCSLRAAIDEANATTGLVQINVPAATYALSRAGVDDTNNNGDLDITGNVSIVGQGGVPVIHGNCQGDRVFDVTGAGKLAITLATVQGGSTSGDGGGIRSAGTLTTRMSSVLDNAADGNGGGIAVTGGTATVASTTVARNQSGASGGGIHVAPGATANVSLSTLSANDATPPIDDPCVAGPLQEAIDAAIGSDDGVSAGNLPALDGTAGSTTGAQPVIVQLEMAEPRVRSGAEALDARAEAVDQVTEDFATTAAATPATAGIEVDTTYSHLPIVVVDATPAEVAALEAQPGVVSVQPVELSAPTMSQSLVRINADDVHAGGATGSGQTVVIIDTGVDANESMTNGKVVAEACFARGQDGLLNGTGDCPGGGDSSTAAGSGTNCPWFAQASACWHGTHVAATAAGASTNFNGTTLSGVAKGANLISVQVFSHFTTTTNCGAGVTDCTLSYNVDQLAALNWVITQTGSFDIASVNMSLGGGAVAGGCDGDSRKVPIDTLRASGVATVIAAGNSGNKAGVGAPGCITTAITVGATDDVTDAIAGFSQSEAVLDVLAPGVNITAEYPTLPGDPNDYFITANGTSMAAPHVAGAIAVLGALEPTASVTALENALESTGVNLTDTNGLTRPRIDLQAAAAEIGFGAGGAIANEGTTTVTLSTIASNVAWTGGGIFQNGGSLSVSGTIVASSTGGNCALGGPATITTGTYNISSDATCWATGGTNSANTNPLLGALASNGGSTQTHLPAVGSPARNVIPNGTAVLCDTSSAVDQRTVARPTGAACDIGSVEN
jgi:CSLREA domain-containing protein